MNIGIFTDRSIRPNEADITAVLGSASKRWTSLVGFVQNAYAVQEELKYLYGKKYGWGLQFRSKGKVLISLLPNEQYFVALVILGVEELREAGNLDLHDHAREAIEAANLYAEGKWLFITVRNDCDQNDVKNLLKIKTQRSRGKDKQPR